MVDLADVLRANISRPSPFSIVSYLFVRQILHITIRVEVRSPASAIVSYSIPHRFVSTYVHFIRKAATFTFNLVYLPL